MSIASVSVAVTPLGHKVLSLTTTDDVEVKVARNPKFPVDADFFVLFLPNHVFQDEAMVIIADVAMDCPIGRDHAIFLLSDTLTDEDDEFNGTDALITEVFNATFV